MVNVLGEAALYPKPEPVKVIDPEPTTCCGILFTWPKSTLIVYLYECGERFVFYGLKGILILYLLKNVGFSPLTAGLIFNIFLALSYIIPFLGGYLADGIFGRFFTIFWFSIIYLTGILFLVIASIFPMGHPVHPWLDIFGIAILTVGNGVIKPSVTVFGVDQLKPHHLSMISIFFALFYIFIQIGGILGTAIVPSFVAMPCMGQQSCFPFAFGITFLVLLVCMFAFSAGSCLYQPIPPIPGVFAKVINTVKIALYVKVKGIGTTREHWLDYYLNIHDCTKHLECIQAAKARAPGSPPNCPQAKFIDDVKNFFALQNILAPVILFWALYEQQSSRWMVQARQMDAQLSPTFFLLPQHMPIFFGILLIILIPIFQFLIYPILAGCGIRLTYLKRMIIGGLFAVMAFILAGIIQMGLNQTMPATPSAGQASLAVINAFPKGCRLVVADVPGYVTPAVIPAGLGLTDNPLAARQEAYQVPVGASSRINPGIQMNGSCSGRGFVRYPMDLNSGDSKIIVVLPQGIFSQPTVTTKPTEGLISSGISINFLIPCKFLPEDFKKSDICSTLASGLNSLTPYNGPLAVCRTNPNATTPCDPTDPTGFYQWEAPTDQMALKAFPPVGDKPQGKATLSHYADGIIGPGPFSVYYVKPGATPAAPAQYVAVENSDFAINGMGGVYVLTIGLADSVLVDDTVANVQAFHQLSPPNYMSIVWQIPQYVLTAVAEIMFAITGLEFVYTQSAPPLKAFSMAFWMANIGFGDLCVIIVQMINPFSNMAYEFFAFAIALFLVLLLMTYMSLSYPYANYTGLDEEEQGLLDVPPDVGADNEGFVNTLVTRL
ncbi:unnamed protein product [Bursaphelenchus okinawaensis]|uniref:MFS domain-containing protein n=1 Tax=Bursaphelenchus okinawaensis TaxID=465554 RepID=A0A811KT92_9BILA|nr:unnamed protein product [Bursaphelenchus okinawaensis]CAG9110915.1 unnamed protein product [Bursaphelenchus okinawaensis]